MRAVRDYFHTHLSAFEVECGPYSEPGLHRLLLRRIGLHCDLRITLGPIDPSEVGDELTRKGIALKLGGAGGGWGPQREQYLRLCRAVRVYLRREFQREPEEEPSNNLAFARFRFETDQRYEISTDDATLECHPR